MFIIHETQEDISKSISCVPSIIHSICPFHKKVERKGKQGIASKNQDKEMVEKQIPLSVKSSPGKSAEWECKVESHYREQYGGSFKN